MNLNAIKDEIVIAYLRHSSQSSYMSRKFVPKDERLNFMRIIDIGNGVNAIDKVSSSLHSMFENPAIIILSNSMTGKFKKKLKRGLFVLPHFNIPISHVKDFDELKNGYEFICLALKKKTEVEQ